MGGVYLLRKELNMDIKEYLYLAQGRFDFAKLNDAIEKAQINPDFDDIDETLTKFFSFVSEICGYLVGDIGRSYTGWKKKVGIRDDDPEIYTEKLDNIIYGIYKESKFFATGINAYIGTNALSPDFLITTLYDYMRFDDKTRSYDLSKPIEYTEKDTDYPYVYERIVQCCEDHTSANFERFSRIVNSHRNTVIQAIYNQTHQFVPHVITPLEQLIDDRGALSKELLACMYELGDLHQRGFFNDPEAYTMVRPLVRHITFLKYCFNEGCVTQELIDEFKADEEAFVEKHPVVMI